MSDLTVAEIAKKKASEYMTDKDRMVCYIAVHGDVLGQTLSEALNIPIEKVFRYLSELTAAKIIVAEGSPSRYNACLSQNAPTTRPSVEQPPQFSATPMVKEQTIPLAELVAEVLKKALNPLNVVEISKELNKPKSQIHSAITNLKNAHRVEKIGRKPYHYSLTAEKDAVKKVELESPKFQITKGESNTNAVRRFMKSHTDYMGVKEIAQLVGLKHLQVAPVISILKRDGEIETYGKNPPLTYRFKEKVSEKVEENKPVVKEKPLAKKHVKHRPPVKTKSVEIIPVKAEPVKKIAPFEDYIIGFTTDKFDKPVFVTHFKDTADFINQFEDLQNIDGIDEICAYKRLTLNERVIFTPELD